MTCDACWDANPPPPVDRQTPVKTLPWPKLLLRAVITGRNEVVAKVMFLLVSVILLTPQEDGYCCGRYASCWNAFLLFIAIFFGNKCNMDDTLAGHFCRFHRKQAKK